jgi:uncharacterized membrane protein
VGRSRGQGPKGRLPILTVVPTIVITAAAITVCVVTTTTTTWAVITTTITVTVVATTTTVAPGPTVTTGISLRVTVTVTAELPRRAPRCRGHVLTTPKAASGGTPSTAAATTAPGVRPGRA